MPPHRVYTTCTYNPSGSAQTEANPATPCRFFNTYIINKNNQAQGQYCAMYTQQWDNSYATISQITHNGDTYQISYSYSYSIADYSYTCVKPAFGCSNPRSCSSGYQNCAESKNTNCYCGTDVTGANVCFQDEPCGAPSCSQNSDCQSGYICLNANNCCGMSVCTAASVCVNKNSKRYIFAKRQVEQKRDAGSDCTATSCPNGPAARGM